MFPALETDLKQETHPDPYEDFMYRHLQYYGYYKGPPRLSSSAVHRQTEAVSRDPFVLSSPLLKRRQLLHDEFGEANPRLREPRDLFAFFSGSEPMQAPRWPIECEVIKENIHHIGNVASMSWSCCADRLDSKTPSFKSCVLKCGAGPVQHLSSHREVIKLWETDTHTPKSKVTPVHELECF